MDYCKMLTEYLIKYHDNHYTEIDVQHWDDLGHTIKVRYYANQSEKKIEITPFELLTFIYEKYSIK